MNRDFKGVWIPAELWLNPDLKLYEKALIAEIDSLDKHGEGAFASNHHYGELLNLSAGRVANILTDLRKRGIVETRRS